MPVWPPILSANHFMMTAASECRIEFSGPPVPIAGKKALETLVTLGVKQANNSVRTGESALFSVACVENSEISAKAFQKCQALGPNVSAKKAMSRARGRVAARAALKSIGLEHPPEVVRGRGGEPVWPDGICGSITHCDPWSVAVAMRSSRNLSVGIDMENMNRIPDLEIAPLVCRSSECEWILASDDRYARLCMIFSAKEALYKSLYPSCRSYIDFREVELSWCADQPGFQVVLFPDGTNRRDGLFISSQRRDNLIFSCSICKIQ